LGLFTPGKSAFNCTYSLLQCGPQATARKLAQALHELQRARDIRATHSINGDR